MDMYRVFVSVEKDPFLWVIDIETDDAIGIAVGVYQYMEEFNRNWHIVSVAKSDERTMDVLIEDIMLN